VMNALAADQMGGGGGGGGGVPLSE